MLCQAERLRLWPARRSALAVAPVAVAAVTSAPAFADEIGEASKKLHAASYPFMQEVDWDSYLFNVKPGTASLAKRANAFRGTNPCDADTLTPVTCQVSPCDADSAPGNGAVIARPSLRGALTCNSGYTVSGTSAGSASTFSPAACQANPCDASSAPDSGDRY